MLCTVFHSHWVSQKDQTGALHATNMHTCVTAFIQLFHFLFLLLYAELNNYNLD